MSSPINKLKGDDNMLIYKITNLINNKIYIGKHNRNDLGYYFGSGTLLKRAIKKYGKENFKIEILEKNILTEDECSIAEKHYISELNSLDKTVGYNIAIGGEGGDTFSNNPNKESIRKKISDKGKLIQPLIQSSDIVRDKKRQTSYANNINVGRTHDHETRKRCASNSNPSEQTKNKIRESNKRGNGISLTGKVVRNKCKTVSIPKRHITDEHRNNLSKSLKNFWDKNVPTNAVKVSIEGKEYDSLQEASLTLNINLSTLRNRLKSKNPLFLSWFRKST